MVISSVLRTDENTDDKSTTPVISSVNGTDEMQIPPIIDIKTINEESLARTHESPPPEKPKKSRKKDGDKKPLVYPFSSIAFMSAWETLRNTPKWKNKLNYALQLSLNKLSNFEEEFAIRQIERAIESGWTGVVFTGTERDYQEWLNIKYGKQESKDKTIGMLIRQQRQECSLTSMQPSNREVLLSTIKQRYPTFKAFSSAYSTSLQTIILSDMEKAYSEKSPTMSDLERMYGCDSSSLWVKTQLLTIDFASSTKESADIDALSEFSRLFVAQYHYIKLTEFLLFIARFKLGKYGKFYGYFDTITVGEAFRKFLRERSEEMDIIIRGRNFREIEERRTVVERYHVPANYIQAEINRYPKK